MKIALSLISIFISTLAMSQNKFASDQFIKKHKPLNQFYSDVNLLLENQSIYFKYDFLHSTIKNQLKFDADLEPLTGLFTGIPNNHSDHPLASKELTLRISDHYFIHKKFHIKGKLGYIGRDFSGKLFPVLHLDGNIGLGYGRINQIDRATSVVFLLKKLKKEGLLTENLSPEDLTSLVNIVNETKFNKLITNRIGQNAIYKKLLSYLMPRLSNERSEEEVYRLIKKSMKSDHLSLSRQSGFRVGINYGGLIFRYKLYNLDIKTQYKGFLFELEHHTPLGVRWQIDQMAYVTQSFGSQQLPFTSNINVIKTEDYKTFYLGHQFGLTYYRNNWTSAFIKGKFNYALSDKKIYGGFKAGANLAFTKNTVLSPYIEVGPYAPYLGLINHRSQNIRLGIDLRI